MPTVHLPALATSSTYPFTTLWYPGYAVWIFDVFSVVLTVGDVPLHALHVSQQRVHVVPIPDGISMQGSPGSPPCPFEVYLPV
jgi:hypothetical protein